MGDFERHRATGRRELHGIVEKIDEHLLEPSLICFNDGKGGNCIKDKLHLPPFRAAPHNGEAIFADSCKVDLLWRERKSFKLDAGEIKNIIHQRQEMRPGMMNIMHIGDIAPVAQRAEQLALHRLRKAKDRVQWCAEFMTDI